MMIALLVLTAFFHGGFSFAKSQEMSGVRLEQFGDFSKKWNLVTVRYREDTKELRFVYANEPAYSALKSGSKFPEGATFAKIGLTTAGDGAFPSSMVPSAARRYQFMIRNEQKFAQTGGWGYALFDSEGRVFPENPADQVRACAACHALVPSRQFVFSQLAPLDPHSSAKNLANQPSGLAFKTVAVDSLSAEDQKKIPKQFKNVRLLGGDLTNETFMGTIDEVRPLLLKESRVSRMPAVLISKKQNYFVMSNPEPQNAEKCPSSNRAMEHFNFLITHNVGLCVDPPKGGD